MQPLLTGVSRYLEAPDTWVVPMGITGTERLFPIGEDTLNPVPIELRIGRPMPVSELEKHAGGDRRRMIETIGVNIARLLPPQYRGVYANRV